MSAPAFRLMLITDEAPGIVGRVERAIARAAPGSIAVQLRQKQLPAGELLALARALRALTARHGALLLVNDRVDVALASTADGVQLPAQGLSARTARELLGPGRLVGASCHDAAELERARAEGADFALLAPVFDVPGKGRALGLEGFGQLARGAGLPVFALGGVTDAHAPALRLLGAHGVAVIRHVLGSEDPAGRVESFLAQLCASIPLRNT
jgi:thiamine-phosphate pyrophosphorylase